MSFVGAIDQGTTSSRFILFNKSGDIVIDDQIDISAVLVASRGDVALHHMDRVIRQSPAMRPGASPVPVGALGNHLTPLLEGVEDHRKIEGRVESRLHTDFDIVEIDKDRELITLLHAYDLNKR